MREAAGRRRRVAGLTRGTRSGSPGWSGWGVVGCPGCRGEGGKKVMRKEADSSEGRICFWDGEGPGGRILVCVCAGRPTELGICRKMKLIHRAECDAIFLSQEHA